MMRSLPDIHLKFDEVDLDLWQALQQIKPEMRSAFIKEALRQVLQTYSVGEKFLTHSIAKNSAKILELQEDQGLIGIERENNEQDSVKKMKTFSLEALFAEDRVPEPSQNNLISSQGYQYMMKTIIGIEDDEAVLKAFKGLSE